MSAEDIESFHKNFFQEIQRSADADGLYAEDAFFERFCEYLEDAGELETSNRTPYIGQRGIRIDGYGGDPAMSEGVLSLIISDFNQSQEMGRLTATEMEAIFKRVGAFLSKALEPAFRNSLEETSSGFGIADLIASSWSAVTKVRLVLISNRVLSARVDGREAGEFAGKPVVYSVWDLSRLHRYASSGKSREELVIEMDEYGGPLPALSAHLPDAGYESYLLVVPGSQLAAIYERWGPRLLEQNVRVFLQARSGVNKGIKKTIETDPGMFFAYNNGLTATAEEVIGRTVSGRFLITGLRNLQIVNGGQTTASIFAASQRTQFDLSKVFVQMKLSVIPPERAEEVVPKISEFANSQNKVNAADFFANHPFHLRMKEFSLVLYAPSRDGAFRESKWFYERARGQYQDARGRLSAADQRKFDLEYPKKQMFSKTDLAKYAAVWDEVPHIVSRGQTKNFAYFASALGKAWEAQSNEFNEAYFRHLVAKAIVFRATESIVTQQPWYSGGGLRAQIVAYTIAKIAHDVRALGRSVNFEAIWRSQVLSSLMSDALALAAEQVNKVITDPNSGMKNVQEWAKQPACWTRVSALTIPWPKAWIGELMSSEEQRDDQKNAVKEQKMLNGIEAQSTVVKAGSPFWKQVAKWAIENHHLSGKELDILRVAASMPHMLPTEKQSIIAMKTLQKLQGDGLAMELDAG